MSTTGTLLGPSPEAPAAPSEPFFEPENSLGQPSFHQWTEGFWLTHDDLFREPEYTGNVVTAPVPTQLGNGEAHIAFNASRHQERRYSWQLIMMPPPPSLLDPNWKRLDVYRFDVETGRVDMLHREMNRQGTLLEPTPGTIPIEDVIRIIKSLINTKDVDDKTQELRDKRRKAEEKLRDFSVQAVHKFGPNKYAEELQRRQKQAEQIGFTATNFLISA